MEHSGLWDVQLPSTMEALMLNLFVVATLLAALSVVVMSGAIIGPAPIIMEFASIMFALSAAVSTLAIAAIEG
jgi:hypothetical protein